MQSLFKSATHSFFLSYRLLVLRLECCLTSPIQKSPPGPPESGWTLRPLLGLQHRSHSPLAAGCLDTRGTWSARGTTHRCSRCGTHGCISAATSDSHPLRTSPNTPHTPGRLCLPWDSSPRRNSLLAATPPPICPTPRSRMGPVELPLGEWGGGHRCRRWPFCIFEGKATESLPGIMRWWAPRWWWPCSGWIGSWHRIAEDPRSWSLLCHLVRCHLVEEGMVRRFPSWEDLLRNSFLWCFLWLAPSFLQGGNSSLILALLNLRFLDRLFLLMNLVWIQLWCVHFGGLDEFPSN